MTEQHECEWIEQIKWCIENEHDFYRCGTGSAVCENCGLTKRESDEMEAMLNEYETLKKIIKRLTGFPREEWDWLLEYLPEDCHYVLEGKDG